MKQVANLVCLLDLIIDLIFCEREKQALFNFSKIGG
jgi:hypothetical protein